MDVSMLTVALLACPLVFSLIMAALPKTTSYSVFAGLNTISVAATLVLSVVTAGTMLSSGQNIDAWACGSISIRSRRSSSFW